MLQERNLVPYIFASPNRWTLMYSNYFQLLRLNFNHVNYRLHTMRLEINYQFEIQRAIFMSSHTLG